jgi:predicted AAA+ superfamily ATPase
MQEFPECQFILSGSSTRKLKRGTANLLGGRAVERFLFPLTYEELEEDFDLDNVLQYGSLPSVIGRCEEEKFDTLNSYVNTYLREELQAERLVRNLGGFARFLNVAASQSGELLNYTSIASDSQLPASTVKEYFQILEDTLLGFTLEPWRKSLRRRLTTSPKFYFFDTGVINAINKSLRAKPVQPRRGKLFEHFIILEVFRTIKYRRSEAELFFWRTSNGAELDLLIHQNSKLVAAIEIKSKPVSSADLSGLRSFAKIYPELKKYVVATVSNEYDLDGSTIIPWQNFLKNELLGLIGA